MVFRQISVRVFGDITQDWAKLCHVVFGLPADLFHVFTKAFSDLLAGVSEGNQSR